MFLTVIVSSYYTFFRWISRPPLRCPRAFGSCVVINDSMWLIGGASKDHANEVLISMASVDKYYPTEAQWDRKTVISNPRHSAAVVAIGKFQTAC